jgi:hypothetical protein
MHYLRDEMTAARNVSLTSILRTVYAINAVQLLSEAITVARTSGDKITLQHCIRSTSSLGVVNSLLISFQHAASTASYNLWSKTRPK